MENIISIFLFISIFLMITGVLYYFLLKNRELQKRLNYYLDIENKYKRSKNNKVKSEDFRDLVKNFNEFIREILKKGLSSGNQQRIDQMLLRAGVRLKGEEYVMLRLFSAAVSGEIFYLLFSNIFFLAIGTFIGFIAPRIWLNGKIRKRVDKFNDGLADMITTIIGSLKAGYSFSQAMKTVAEESQSPVKEEIEILLNELSYGITMEEALNNLNRRMPSMDLELMIHATLIQRQIGGNLSTILEIIVNTIRERKKLERHVKTLTAQGRLSGKVISGIPVFLAAIMYILNKEYLISFLSNRYGQIAVAASVLSCIIGFVVINRITKIEV
ncbi:MAG: type II secretion system F family protein [Clostridiaceae bacterium]